MPRRETAKTEPPPEGSETTSVHVPPEDRDVTKAGEAGPFERKIFKTEPPPEESETVMGVPAAEDAEVAKMEEGPVASMMQRTISSISEAANLASGGWDAPWFLRWFEIPFQVKNPKDGKLLPEATGWAMDSCGRGPLNQVGGFIGAAVLRLATVDAGCINPGDCDNTLKGLKPSSLLTTTSALVGVIAAILMPAVGAVVDHTRHRKLMAVLSGIIVVGMTGIQISISIERNNWFFILVVDAIQSFFLLVHSTAVFAYLPDLTTDEEVIPHYSSHFQIRQYAVQFLFASLLAIAGRVRGSDRTALESSVQTARDGAGMAFGFGALFFSYAWIFLFRKRPALSKVPEGQNLVSTGFVKVKKTFSKIQKDYRALRWFLFSLLWSPDAGAGVVLSIAISFLTVEIGFTGQDFAKLSLVTMSSNIFGAIVVKYFMKYVNPLNSYRVGLTMLAVAIGVTVAVLDGPDKKPASYGFAASWGFFMGWTYPSQRVLFCTLIPKGQETEMMGLFTFAGQILGWLPPLIVTIMTENNVNLRYGVLVLSGFCMLAVVCTLFMGNYKEATELVAADSAGKLAEVHRSFVHGSTSSKATDESTTHREDGVVSSESGV